MPSTETLAKRSAPHVGMGQILLGRAGDRLGAVLGSCVGVIVYHPRMRLAAMAHVVLPESTRRSGQPGKFADTAIPEMLRMLAGEGAHVSGLNAKIAGGANMFGAAPGPMQIGEGNSEAVKQLLRKHNVRLTGEHLGGSKGRRVTFDCDTGLLTIEVVGCEPAIV